MAIPPRQKSAGLMLRTFGIPGLLDGTGVEIPFKGKDLALLIFIVVENRAAYARSALAAQLWGDRAELKALHSLTQSLRRLRRVVGSCLTLQKSRVAWQLSIECDALALEGARAGAAEWDPDLYTGDFVSDFECGPGANGFNLWVDGRRARYRMAMIHLLDDLGAKAEAERDWVAALNLAQRVVEVEPFFEEGHRRVMRSWAARGERALALQHYYQFGRWLDREYKEPPDPQTVALAEALRGGDAADGTEHDTRSRRTRPHWEPWSLDRRSSR